jgi:pilus assembly protein Flp/PilA
MLKQVQEIIYMQYLFSKEFALKTYLKAQCLKDEFIRDESGQDTIEYIVVAGLIALGATATFKAFALNLSTAFSQIGSKLVNYTS